MDYYKILGVNKNSSYEEIRKNYKELAIKYHPDKNKNPDANEKFKEINEAYKTLSDPNSKAQYDNMFERGQYNDINNMFSMNFEKAMKMFNDMFNNNSLGRNMFIFPTINLSQMQNNIQNNRQINPNIHFTAISTNIVNIKNKDGKIITKQNVKINENGKINDYTEEYYIDNLGQKHLIKEENLVNKTINKNIEN